MNNKKYISLELAKKIHETAKEKGIKLPESEYWWEKDTDCDMARFDGGYNLISHEPSFGGYPAYDTYELGEMLPAGMQSNRIDLSDCVVSQDDEWHCWMWNFKTSKFAETEPEARGKMLQHLLELNRYN